MNEKKQPREATVYEGLREQIVDIVTSWLEDGGKKYEAPEEAIQQIQPSLSGVFSWPLPPIKSFSLKPNEMQVLTRKTTIRFIPPRINIESSSGTQKCLSAWVYFHDIGELSRELREGRIGDPNELLLLLHATFLTEFNPRFELNLYRKTGEEKINRRARIQDLELVRKLLDIARPVV